MKSIKHKQIALINFCFIVFGVLLRWIAKEYLGPPTTSPEGDHITLAKYSLECARASSYLHAGFFILVIAVNSILIFLPHYFNNKKCSANMVVH